MASDPNMIDLISAGTQVVILIVAFRALNQVTEAVKQNHYNRQQNTLEWLEKYLLTMEKADSRTHVIQKEYKRGGVELKNYDFWECALLPKGSEEWKVIANQKIYYDAHPDAFHETVWIANKIELIASALLQEAWDLEIAKNLIAGVHCAFVEDEVYVYCKNRNDRELKIFDCTMELYHRFKSSVGSREEQTKRFLTVVGYVADESKNERLKKLAQGVVGSGEARQESGDSVQV